MARLRSQIEGTLAEELYNKFLGFIAQDGAIPMERPFWRWLIAKRYYTLDSLPNSTFRYWFGLLVDEGWIKIEPITRALKPQRGVTIKVDPLDT